MDAQQQQELVPRTRNQKLHLSALGG